MPCELVASKMSADSIKTVHTHATQEPARATATIRLAAISPEIMTVIEAAVTAFVGRRLRIVSVKAGLEHQAVSSSWAHQGRDMIHGSHNLVQRGR
jgi:hypothetical protein